MMIIYSATQVQKKNIYCFEGYLMGKNCCRR